MIKNKHGFIYIAKFDNGMCKFGFSMRNPKARISSHERLMRITGSKLVDYWVSIEHEYAYKNEQMIRKFVNETGSSDGEWTSISFEVLTEFASNLQYKECSVNKIPRNDIHENAINEIEMRFKKDSNDRDIAWRMITEVSAHLSYVVMHSIEKDIFSKISVSNDELRNLIISHLVCSAVYGKISMHEEAMNLVSYGICGDIGSIIDAINDTSSNNKFGTSETIRVINEYNIIEKTSPMTKAY